MPLNLTVKKYPILPKDSIGKSMNVFVITKKFVTFSFIFDVERGATRMVD